MPPTELDLGGWRLAWESSPALVAVVVGEGATLAYQNARCREIFGARPVGVPLLDAFPEMDTGIEPLHEVMRTGRTVEVRSSPIQVPTVDGGRAVLHYVLAPFGSGPPFEGVVVTAIDVTASVLAEREGEQDRLLARLSAGVIGAASPDEALQYMTDALVPAVADVAAVYVVAPGQAPHTQGSAVPPVAVTVSADLLERFGPPPPQEDRTGPSPWAAVLGEGRAVIIDVRRPADREAMSTGSRTWLERVAASTLVVLPLGVAGDLAGAVVLVAAGGRAPFEESQIPFLEDLTARVGVAVGNLRSAHRQREVVLDLQRALLPPEHPWLPGIDIATRYVAGAPDVEVGGDWWDVAHLGAGRIGLGVGDVSGRGVRAAALMGQVRAAMRAVAHADLAPSDLLALLDLQVSDLVEPKPHGQETITPPRFATSVYGVLDPFDETLQLASAGHLPVLVRRPDGTVDVVGAPPGPPLGLALGPFEELVTPFPAGSVLVAFTDGLVESRDVDLDVGIARLAAELEKVVPDGDLEVAADRLLAAAGSAGGQDDVALVLLRVTAAAAPSARAQWVLAGLADTAVARRVVRGLARDAVPDRVDEAVQVASELAANALEHGAPPVRLRVHATAHRLVIAATDTSALAPRPTVAGVDDERGRGLAIVARLSDAWGVRLSRSGKTTWAEFLTDAGRADRAGRGRPPRSQLP